MVVGIVGKPENLAGGRIVVLVDGVRPIGSFSGSAASFCLLDAPAAAQASRRDVR
jgi:hypothetical protein